MQNLPINTLHTVLFFIIICSLPNVNIWACDTTPTQTAGNIQYAGDGLYTIDIQNCIGDAGSEDGFSIGVSNVNIVGFTPTTIENILNGNTATGTFGGGLVTYDYIGAGYFVEAGQNTCFWTTITVDGFPNDAEITLSGVNTLGGCAILNGDTQVTPVIQVPICGEMFYDTGGSSGPYGTGENYSLVICGGGGPVTIQFTEFQLAFDGDIMTIYDNDGTSGPSNFHTGGNSPGTVTSTNSSNCLTVAFESNSFGEEAAGWAAEILCPIPCPNGLEVDVLSNESTCLTSGDGEVSTMISGGTIPFNFEWNTGDTGDKIQDLGAGTYIVTVTDGNGCVAIDSTTVNVSISIESNITGTMVDCGMANGTASISVLGGGQPPYNFMWNTDETAEFISGLDIGEYTVTITDADGCQGIESIILVNDTDLDANVTVVDSVSCYGYSDGVANAIVTGGTGTYTYSWDSYETTETATQLPAGEHTVTVMDAENCTVVDSFSIEEPPMIDATIDSSPVSCFGGNDGIVWVIPDGGVDNFTYEWSSGQIENTVTGLSEGDYTVSVTNSTGCVANYDIKVEQPSAALTSIFQSTTDPTCGGYTNGIAQLRVNGGTPAYTYAWSSGESTDIAENLIAGTNYVTITDANNCTLIDSIVLNEPNPISYLFNTEDVTCFGEDIGSIEISDVSGGNGNGTYTYSLDGENYMTTSTFIRLEAGDYEFYIQDSEGCITTDSFTINQLPEIVVDLGEDIELAYGDSVVLSPTINQYSTFEYQWTTQSPDSLSCMDCDTLSVMPFYDTDYTLQVTDANGCIGTDKIRVNVRKTQRVFIPNAFTPNDDNINDVFIVHGDSAALSAHIRIYNRWGDLVYENIDATLNNLEDGWDGKHNNNSESSAGVYVYFIEVQFIGGEILPYSGQVTLIR